MTMMEIMASEGPLTEDNPKCREGVAWHTKDETVKREKQLRITNVAWPT